MHVSLSIHLDFKKLLIEFFSLIVSQLSYLNTDIKIWFLSVRNLQYLAKSKYFCTTYILFTFERNF